MHPLDKTIQIHCPTVMVPRYGELEPMATAGHRFLASCDGLWLEVCRPWLRLCWPVALQEHVSMPYGKLEPAIQFAFDSLPRELFGQFREDARRALPNEFAAWITWDSGTQKFAYHPLAATDAGPAHLSLERPVLGETEHLVVDIHSHGHLPAGFSSEDNRDDAGEVKFSVVMGRLGADQVASTRMRLCANGLRIKAADLKAVSDLFVG
jgi:PRTRC genetic system protein A